MDVPEPVPHNVPQKDAENIGRDINHRLKKIPCAICLKSMTIELDSKEIQ